MIVSRNALKLDLIRQIFKLMMLQFILQQISEFELSKLYINIDIATDNHRDYKRSQLLSFREKFIFWLFVS